jgi:hypothetical protein
MITFELITHQWKSIFRNETWRRNVLGKVLLLFVLAYMVFMFFIIGLNITNILKSVGGNPITVFNSVLLWYFSIDIIIRFFLQTIPVINIIPYINLNIKRSVIINYIISKSFINVFNFIPLLIIIPFIFKILLPEMGVIASLSYFTGICFTIILINSFSVLLKFVLNIIPMGFAICIFGMYSYDFPLGKISSLFASLLINFNIIIFASILITTIIIVYTTKYFLKYNFYLDES